MLAIILTIKGHFTTRFSACVRPDGDSDGDSKDAAKSVGFYYLITALRARLASTGRKQRERKATGRRQLVSAKQRERKGHSHCLLRLNNELIGQLLKTLGWDCIPQHLR